MSRYYDPQTGRFISSTGVSGLNPQAINGLNLYSYAGNNPLHYSLNTTTNTANSPVSNSANSSANPCLVGGIHHTRPSSSFNLLAAVGTLSTTFSQADQWIGYLSGGFETSLRFLGATTRNVLFQPYEPYLTGLKNFGIGMIVVGSVLSFAESAYNNSINPNYTSGEAVFATLMDAGYYTLKGIGSCALGGLLTNIAVGAAVAIGGTLGGIAAVVIGVVAAVAAYAIWEGVDWFYGKIKEWVFE